MYVKMFKSIFDGTLYGQFEPTVVFMAMLVIAEREGIVDMTPQAIAARCGYPLAIVLKGIKELEKPDYRSRTPDEEGRRIIRLEENRDWGWRITNYQKYEKIRSAEERREYFRLKKREQRSKTGLSTNVHTVHQSPPPNLKPNLQPKTQNQNLSGVSQQVASRNSDPAPIEILRQLIDSAGARPQRTARIQKAIDRAGGWPQIENAFCVAYLEGA
jgi:hypothetical protein